MKIDKIIHVEYFYNITISERTRERMKGRAALQKIRLSEPIPKNA